MMTSKRTLVGGLVGTLLYLSLGDVATAAEDRGGCRAPLEAWTQVELYLGRNIGGGGVVGEPAFRRFLAEVVTPEFPDGLTVLDGQGQFRDSKGVIVREGAKVLLILVPDAAAAAGRFDKVIARYKKRFRQESVIRVETPVCLAFQ